MPISQARGKYSFCTILISETVLHNCTIREGGDNPDLFYVEAICVLTAELATLNAPYAIGRVLDRSAGVSWQKRVRLSLHSLLLSSLPLFFSNTHSPSPWGSGCLPATLGEGKSQTVGISFSILQGDYVIRKVNFTVRGKMFCCTSKAWTTEFRIGRESQISR